MVYLGYVEIYGYPSLWIGFLLVWRLLLLVGNERESPPRLVYTQGIPHFTLLASLHLPNPSLLLLWLHHSQALGFALAWACVLSSLIPNLVGFSLSILPQALNIVCVCVCVCNASNARAWAQCSIKVSILFALCKPPYMGFVSGMYDYFHLAFSGMHDALTSLTPNLTCFYISYT